MKLSFVIAAGCPGPEKKNLFSDNWPYDWIGGSLHCPRPSLTLMVIEGLANVCEASTGTAQPSGGRPESAGRPARSGRTGRVRSAGRSRTRSPPRPPPPADSRHPRCSPQTGTLLSGIRPSASATRCAAAHSPPMPVGVTIGPPDRSASSKARRARPKVPAGRRRAWPQREQGAGAPPCGQSCHRCAVVSDCVVFSPGHDWPGQTSPGTRMDQGDPGRHASRGCMSTVK